MKILLKLVLIVIISGCSGLVDNEPTNTPTAIPTSTIISTPTETATVATTITPTSSPTNTLTPIPAITTTPDLLEHYISLLPDIPPGFEWKILLEYKLAVLIPEGWYFKLDKQPDPIFDGIFVTKENIDETGRFSTGLSIFIKTNLSGKIEAEEYALNFLRVNYNSEMTKEILEAFDLGEGPNLTHHLRIRSEFPYETEENIYKVVHCTTLSTDTTVYLSIFESPEDIWEETLEDFGIVLDYIVVFLD